MYRWVYYFCAEREEYFWNRGIFTSLSMFLVVFIGILAADRINSAWQFSVLFMRAGIQSCSLVNIQNFCSEQICWLILELNHSCLLLYQVPVNSYLDFGLDGNYKRVVSISCLGGRLPFLPSLELFDAILSNTLQLQKCLVQKMGSLLLLLVCTLHIVRTLHEKNSYFRC